MRIYKVSLVFTVTKVYTVEAENEHVALDVAHSSQMHGLHDYEVEYEESSDVIEAA